MKPLFPKAVYVNRRPDSLEDADRGAHPSLTLTEHKGWRRAKRFFDQAERQGYELPLIFAYEYELLYWAVAREISIYETDDRATTEYRFAELQKLKGGYYRNDLTVLETGKPLSRNFIRSYALVKTPDFLGRKRTGAATRLSEASHS